MATVDKYILDVEARTQKAEADLQNIYKLMNDIESVKRRADEDYETVSQKGMDKSMKAMAKITAEKKKLEREITSLQVEIKDTIAKTGTDGSFFKETGKNSERDLQQVKKQLDSFTQNAVSQAQKVDMAHRRAHRSMKAMATYQKSYSKNFVPKFESKDTRNLPRETKVEFRDKVDPRTGEKVMRRGRDGQMRPVKTQERVLDYDKAKRISDARLDAGDPERDRIRNVKEQAQEAKRMVSKGSADVDRAVSSNYMSYQQYAGFDHALNRSQTEYVGREDENRHALAQIGLKRSEAQDEVRGINAKPAPSREERDRVVALERDIKLMDEEYEAREELNESLNSAIKRMKEFDEQLAEGKDGRGVEVKPERGTIKGMAYERAPAIGLAITGAVGLALGSLFSKGGQANESMRDDVIAIGQRAGTEDDLNWRKGVRNPAQEAGLEDFLGISGQEMLNLQQNMMRNRGGTPQDIQDAGSAQARFSRVTGTSVEDTADFFDTVLKSATIDSLGITDIQNAFVGGIKQSGMQGREEQQLDVLKGLLDTMGRGRTVDSAEVQRVIGMQTMLAQSGREAFQGEKGGQFMQSMDEGIRSLIDDPQGRLLLGFGTEHKGGAGYREAKLLSEEGFSSPEVANRMMALADIQTPEREEDGRAQIDSLAGNFSRLAGQRGMEISQEHADGMAEMYLSGEFTEKGLEKLMQQTSQEGGELSDEKLENYQGQKEGLANQADAVIEKQSARLNDYGDVVKRATTMMSGIPAVAFATITALGALSVAAVGTASAMGTGSLLRTGMGSLYKGGGKNLGSGATRIGSQLMGLFGLGKGGGGKTPPTGTSTATQSIQQRMASTTNSTASSATTATATAGATGMFGKMSQGAKGIFNKATGKEPKPPTTPPSSSSILPNQGQGLGGIGAGASEGLKGLTASGLGSTALSGLKGSIPFAGIVATGNALTAPKGERLKSAGEGGGGIAGAMSGAKVGTAIGTAIAPGIGTAVGTIGGSIIGSILGSKLGGWIGDAMSSAWGWVKGIFGFGKNDEKEQATQNEPKKVLSQAEIDKIQKENDAKIADARNEVFSEYNADINKSIKEMNEARSTYEDKKDAYAEAEKKYKEAKESGTKEEESEAKSALADADFELATAEANKEIKEEARRDLEEKKKKEMDKAEKSVDLEDAKVSEPKKKSDTWEKGDGFWEGTKQVFKDAAGLESAVFSSVADLFPEDDLIFKHFQSEDKKSIEKAKDTPAQDNVADTSTKADVDKDVSTQSVGQSETISEDDMVSQVERENETLKEKNENKRGDNVLAETSNLTKYEILLNTAQNLLNQAKSQNGIFGDPGTGEGGHTSAILSGDDNAEQIWNFFKQQGFSDEGTAGILGNLQLESNLDPTNVNASSGAYGIAQWLGGRKKNLESYAKSSGGSKDSLETQLEFLMKELNEGRDVPKSLKGKLQSSKSVTGAANLFEKEFERSGGAGMTQRREYAKQHYNETRLNANVTVNVRGGESTGTAINNSKGLERIGYQVHDKIRQSMDLHSKETRRR